MSTYRYPGVKPFETSDQHIFFGRDQNIADLYDLIVLEKLVVLFGKSGYGKSSLLNAGILPKFQTALPDSDLAYQPITVRFNLYVDDRSIPPLEQVRRRLLEETNENPEGNFLANDTLWQQFKRRQAAAERHFLLVFDQFEEFFSYPKAQQIQFKEELAELLYKTLPQSVRDALDDFSAEQRRYLSRKLDVKAVFAIRSDRMSDLDSLKDKLPAILYKRYELKGLSPEQAKQAIIAPAALLKDNTNFICDPFHYTEGALDKIVRELSAVDETSTAAGNVRSGIEAFQLQILCQYIENEVINRRIRDRNNDGMPDVDAADLPDIANVYEAYYRSQLDKLDPSEREAARELIEYGLLYEDPQKGEARRLSVDADLLVQQFAAQGATQNLLKRLENTFLLRREMNTLGGYNYELSHDTLIAPVLKAKAEREAEKERFAAERRAQEAEAQARAERRRSRRATIFAIVGFLLAAISIVALVLAFFANREANRQKQAAVNQKQQAEQATQRAEAQKQLADSSALVAQQKSAEAEKAQNEALTAKNKVDATLRDLQRTAAQTVTLLLREADQNILQLNYDAAFDKCRAALGLGQQRSEVVKHIQEVAFFYTESEQPAKANATLHLLQIKTSTNRKALLKAIQQLDPAHYTALEKRYYPDMVSVAGGTFIMGSKYGKENDQPPHTVTLSSYKIARTETTIWQYNLFAVATSKSLEAPGWGLWGNNPIVNVNWHNAIAYANWLSERKGLPAVYVYSGNLRNSPLQVNWEATGYRLPTEAEWEFAARGGNLEKDKNYIYAGGNNLDEVGWYFRRSLNRTQPVAQKKPNALGLYDMTGNVSECCWDRYAPYAAYPNSLNPLEGNTATVQNPHGAESGNTRVARGGSWNTPRNYCYVFSRSSFFEGSYSVGFRLAGY